MKSLPRGPAGPGEVWPGASTDAPSPRKVSKHAAGGFRALGKRQNAPLKVSDASEGSKHAAEGFRGVGEVSPAGQIHQTRTRLSSPASVDARRLPQTPRGSVHQKRELAPPPPLDPPPQEPPLELPPLLHEELLLLLLELLPAPPLVKFCLKSFSSLTWPHSVQT